MLVYLRDQTDKQINRKKYTERQADKCKQRQTGRQKGTQTDTLINRDRHSVK